MPPNPGGWLMLTARRKAVDQLRRDRAVSVDPELLEAEAEPSGGVAGDDRLAMIFACCHPAFALPVRVAMTLRYVAGLTTPRAVAVGMADGPQAGLAVLEPVLAAGTLAGYAPLHAAHSDLLERLGSDEAAAAWARAAQAAGNTALQRELRRREQGDGETGT
jgi:predicted RNA polymerase sigma factor